jgi:hypothetical protein
MERAQAHRLGEHHGGRIRATDGAIDIPAPEMDSIDS